MASQSGSESKTVIYAAPPELQDSILEIAASDPAIRHANGVVTSQLGPDQVVVALSADFEDHLTTPEIEACINRLESLIHEKHPEVTGVFVKPQQRQDWAQNGAGLEPPDDSG